MTGATRRWRVPAAVLGAAAGCLLGGLIAGAPLMRPAVAIAVLITTGVVVGRWARPTVVRPPAYRGGRTSTPTGCPTYDELLHTLSWAETSKTYTDRVLQPRLRALAEDLGVTDLPAQAPPLVVAERLEREVGDAAR